MTFYAYVHARPDTTDSSGVFYVGKGVGSRYRPLPARNRHHGFVLDKHGVENILVGKFECSSEEIAFELERGLIKCLRRAGVSLTNMTDGGEGSSGYVMTQEAKDKLAIRAAEVARRPGVAESRSVATTASNNERWADPEYKARTSEAMRGKKKTLSPEALEARRINAKKASTPEANAAKAAASKVRWADPEFRERMAAKKRAAWNDTDKRAAMLAGRSEGIAKSWQDEITRNNRIRGIKKAMNTSQKDH